MYNLKTLSVFSRHLNDYRLVSLLIPATSNFRHLYLCTDGQAFQSLVAPLNAAVTHHQIPPVLLAGAYSGNMRAQEYLQGVDTIRFAAHEAFFTEELPQFIENEFGRPLDPEKCGVFGFSNGAAFAISMCMRHPDLFRNCIAFSVPSNRLDDQRFSKQLQHTASRYYLAAGRREKPFLRTTREFAQSLSRVGIRHEFVERDYGHELEFWGSELPRAIHWIEGDIPIGSAAEPTIPKKSEPCIKSDRMPKWRFLHWLKFLVGQAPGLP